MSGLLFPLGQTVATPRALAALEEARVAPACLLVRHQNGDWGELSPEDAEANEQALDQGDRILSSYVVGGRKVWIITEADRSATTLLLPETTELARSEATSRMEVASFSSRRAAVIPAYTPPPVRALARA